MRYLSFVLILSFYVSIAQSTFSTAGGSNFCETKPAYESKINIKIEGEYRLISCNSIPNHTVGQFPTRGNPNKIAPQEFNYKLPLHPKRAKKFTSVYSGDEFGTGRPSYEFGVAINGVNMEPSAMEAFENTKTGERNFDWTKEALSTSVRLGEDCNNAHVQPTGKYHYHGTPHGLIKNADGKGMFLTAWAADGFPVYYKYGYEDPMNPKSKLIILKPSYRLKKGERGGDGINTPSGKYDGTYVRDFEYIDQLGDLDKANGRFGVTPEFPEGTYFYVITDEFPSLPRYFVGTPSDDFKLGGGHRGNRNNRKGNKPNGKLGKGRPQHGKGEQRGKNQGFQKGGERPKLEEVFKRLDSNEDGKISKEEAKGPLSYRFNEIDTNKDGVLSKEEVQNGRPKDGGAMPPPR